MGSKHLADFVSEVVDKMELSEIHLVVGLDKAKAPRVVEPLLITRRALYDTVYYHKTVRSAARRSRNPSSLSPRAIRGRFWLLNGGTPTHRGIALYGRPQMWTPQYIEVPPAQGCPRPQGARRTTHLGRTRK